MPFSALICGIGLLAGVATSFFNYYLTYQSSKFILDKGSARPRLFSVLSYIIRLVIYGIIFYIFAKIYLLSGLFTVLGFMASRVYIVVKYAIKPNFSHIRYEKIKTKNFLFESVPFKQKYVIIRIHNDTASSRVRLVTHRKWNRYRQL